MHKLLPTIVIVIALALLVWLLRTSNFDIRRYASGDETASPTAFPRVSPTPLSPLTISTSSLPMGYVGRNYSTLISGYTIDTRVTLTFNAAGLPAGVNLTNCTSNISGSKNVLQCYLKGTPTQSGIYPVNLILFDNARHKTTKTLNLFVIRI